MSSLAQVQPTLASTLWPVREDRMQRLLRAVLLAVVGSALVAVSAQIRVDLGPVPLTMQPFAVVLLGAAFGARLGAATLVLYIVEGAFGMPVFSGMKAGLPVLVGPTGGYIIGFAFAAGFVGWMAERGWDRHFVTTIFAMTGGMILIYVPGYVWLSTMLGMDRAFELGVLPFVLGDAIKVVLAALVLPGAWQLLKKLR